MTEIRIRHTTAYHSTYVRWVAHNMLRTFEVKQVFSEKKIGLDDYINVIKCLQQIEIPNLLHMCATGSELASNISTVRHTYSMHFSTLYALSSILTHS